MQSVKKATLKRQWETTGYYGAYDLVASCWGDAGIRRQSSLNRNFPQLFPNATINSATYSSRNYFRRNIYLQHLFPKTGY